MYFKFFLAGSLFLSLNICANAEVYVGSHFLDLDSDVEVLHTKSNIEPSGLAIEGDLLYVISDNGRMQVFDTRTLKSVRSYKIKNKKGKVKKADYEGLTTDNRGNMYVAIEGKDDIGIFNGKRDQIVRKIKIDRYYAGEELLKKGGNGIEAIAFWKHENGSDYFFISNQSNNLQGDDRSSILVVKVKDYTYKGRISAYYPAYVKDLSGMTILDGKLIFISDTENKILSASIFDRVMIRDSMIESEEMLIGKNQEGIAFGGGYAYIAQDSGDILRIKMLKR